MSVYYYYYYYYYIFILSVLLNNASLMSVNCDRIQVLLIILSVGTPTASRHQRRLVISSSLHFSLPCFCSALIYATLGEDKVRESKLVYLSNDWCDSRRQRLETSY